MKIIVLLICLVSVSILWVHGKEGPFSAPKVGANKTKLDGVFLISKVGADKTELYAAFSAIQKIEKTKKYGNPTSFQVFQKLNDKGFLVHKTATRYRTIASGLSSVGGGGGAYTTSSEVTDYSKLYYLATIKPQNLADGDRIKSIWIINTSKTKSYTDTKGSKRTVRILHEIIPVDLSQQDFIKRLKGGESWVLKQFRVNKCHKCFGDGKLSALRKYAKCPDCKGKGDTSFDCIVMW